MRNIKKLLSIAMVLAMVLSLGVSAFAATVVVDEDAGDNFTAWQIFAGSTDDGDPNEGAPGHLGDIIWGSAITDGDAFIEALQNGGMVITDKDGDDSLTVKDVALTLGENLDEDNAAANKFAQLAYEYMIANGIEGNPLKAGDNVVADGYYLIVETGDSDDNGVINPALLQLTDKGVFHIQKKATVPEVNKTVTDVNDTTGLEEEGDSADYDIGDDVPYTLTATLGEGYEKFEKYYLKFTDELSKGLTLNVDSITITDKNGNNIKDYFTINSNTDEDSGETTLTITAADLKTVPGLASGDTITVKYTAQLNEDAKIGVEGNPNTVKLTYSNNPNDCGEGRPTDDTTPDTVIVFTFDQLVNKEDASGKALQGAGFTLLKKVKTGGTTKTFFEGTVHEYSYDSVQVVDEFTAGDATSFSFKGIDDGEYILVESTVPEGYNKAEDIRFLVEAVHSDGTEVHDGGLTEFKVSVWDENANEGAGGWVEQKSSDEKNETVLGVQMKPATGSMITGDVVNNSGLELPETGGIGTTIFYAVGAILVVGAVILLVSRKRAGSAQK